MKQSAKILIVDDDPNFVDATKRILENKSYQVKVAYDKEEAMKKIEENRPDLILLDIMMEKLNDGFTICYKLKHDPQLKQIQVLVLSAITKETGLKFSPQADGEYFEADGYLEKPVSAEKLLSRVENLLKG